MVSSAIPDSYYVVFGIVEPLLCILGFFGALADPKATHDGQAPWPSDRPPADQLPRATLVTLIQLAHVCALMGLVNYFVLSAARRIKNQPALQESIVYALLTPLLFGDFFHLFVTLWALGDKRWDLADWSPTLWTTMGAGLTLLVPPHLLAFGNWSIRRRQRRSLSQDAHQ
ncbi:hypothetical protein C8J56DRAFT_550893 [Mycena floridula]|nr:hypothetical protein C8J56DRAFT_550893 [Mycena floridula]